MNWVLKRMAGVVLACVTATALLTMTVVLLLGRFSGIGELAKIAIIIFPLVLIVGGLFGVPFLAGFRALRVNAFSSSLLAGGLPAYAIPWLFASGFFPAGAQESAEIRWALVYLFVVGVLAGGVYWLVVYRKPDAPLIAEARIINE